MADGLLNKASIILTPTGYKAGTLYNVAPVVEPYEDFDFARASVASRVNSSGLVEMVGRTLGSELVQNGDFSEIGPELVTNGDFATDSDWTLGTGWSIANGKASYDNSGTASLTQSFTWESGKTYEIQFEVSDFTSNYRFDLYSGSSFIQSAIVTDKTTWKIYFVGDGGTTMRFRALTTGAFSLDNVSVKQVDPNDYWNLGTGWSIEDGKASFNGGSDANIIQTNSDITIGNTFKITLDVSDMDNGELSVRLGRGASTEIARIQDNGPYVFYGVSISSNITFRALSSFDGSIDNVSVKEVIDTNNIPRISYDSNGENGHILLEPTSTNLITYSEDFSEWTNISATLTPNQSSPDGSDNAYIVEDDNPSAYERVDETITTTATPHTFSVFIKKKTSAVSSYGGIQMGVGFSYVIFDSYNGTYNQQSNTNYDSIEVENFSSDWWRLKLTATLTTSTRVALWGAISTNGTSISTSATGSETYFGAQLEELSYATSYIPTLTGSTETRATETATGAGSATLINSTEGVLYAEIAALANDLELEGISLSDGGLTNRVVIFKWSTSNGIRARVTSNGSNVFNSTTIVTDIKSFNKIALKYKENDFALWINGVEVLSDASGAIPIGLNTLDFTSSGVSGSPFYGKCKALAVFNEALSDDELNNLTG